MGSSLTSCQRRAAARLAIIASLVAIFLVLASHPVLIGRPYARLHLRLAGAEFTDQSQVVWQETLRDCGPAALANLARLLDHDLPELSELRKVADTGVLGTGSRDLVRAASGVGINLRRARLGLDEFMGRVGIAWVERSHFVVVFAARGHPLEVIDPLAGRYEIGIEAFRAHWSGIVLVPSPSDSGTIVARLSGHPSWAAAPRPKKGGLHR